jgi:CRISP-associated protein Cas1
VDYIIRLRPSGVKKLVDELDKAFTQSVKYNGKNNQWNQIIQLKAQELSNYLVNKLKKIDFHLPEPSLERVDNREIRDKILNLSYSEWEKMGYSKGNLHYMKQNAKANKPFALNQHIRDRLDGIQGEVK